MAHLRQSVQHGSADCRSARAALRCTLTMASVAIRVDVEPDMTPYAKAPRQLRAVEASSCPVRVNQTESIAPILCGRSPLFPGGFVQDLGRDLYVGSNRLAMTRMDLSINVQ